MNSPDAFHRGDVVRLRGRHPTGREIKKDRPWVVVSPNEVNNLLGTVMVVPLTTGRHLYPFRIACTFDGLPQHIILDQLDTVDHRLVHRRVGAISPQALKAALATLREMFEE